MDDDSPPQLAIAIADPRWRRLFPDPERRLGAALAATLERAGLPARGRFLVEVTLADDVTVQALNARHRGRNAPTDVLSFPQFAPEELARLGRDGPPVPLGDIVLASGTVERDARSLGRPVEAHALHLFVHGLLHLLGHDHEEEEEARRMERLEAGILATLGIADPYAQQEMEP